MDPEKVVKLESIMNKEDDTLPYAYFNPETEGKLTWICNQDAEGKYTSVFCYDYGSHKDKKPTYIPDMEKVKYIRKELIDNGWKKLEPPEVTFTFPGEKNPRTMSRREKRYLNKKMKNMNKKNPFESSDGSLPPPST